MLLGKSWVYRYIFKDIFPFLYGSETIQRNRLALTDEDASEYRTFETMTSRVPEYKRSKIMLCTFHAIWKYFKEIIRPTLPKKGVMLSETGRQYGTSPLQYFSTLHPALYTEVYHPVLSSMRGCVVVITVCRTVFLLFSCTAWYAMYGLYRRIAYGYYRSMLKVNAILFIWRCVLSLAV